MDISKAVDILRAELKKEEGTYIAWKANIAMAFYDEWRRNEKKDIHKIANKAADNFLKQLIER